MFNTSAYYKYGIQKFELVSITPTIGSNLYYREDITFTLMFNQNVNFIAAGCVGALEYVTFNQTNYVYIFPESIIGNTFSVSFGPPFNGLHALGPAILHLSTDTIYGNINNHFLTNVDFSGYTIVDHL
jgi:hypothetical protein